MRGDVHLLNAPREARGHEQRGRRLAVVLQSDHLPLSTLLVAPTSTRAKPSVFRPEIEVVGVQTLVMVEQVVAVDPGRLGDIVGHLTRGELEAVERALTIVFELR